MKSSVNYENTIYMILLFITSKHEYINLNSTNTANYFKHLKGNSFLIYCFQNKSCVYNIFYLVLPLKIITVYISYCLSLCKVL